MENHLPIKKRKKLSRITDSAFHSLKQAIVEEAQNNLENEEGAIQHAVEENNQDTDSNYGGSDDEEETNHNYDEFEETRDRIIDETINSLLPQKIKRICEIIQNSHSNTLVLNIINTDMYLYSSKIINAGETNIQNQLHEKLDKCIIRLASQERITTAQSLVTATAIFPIKLHQIHAKQTVTRLRCIIFAVERQSQQELTKLREKINRDFKIANTTIEALGEEYKVGIALTNCGNVINITNLFQLVATNN